VIRHIPPENLKPFGFYENGITEIIAKAHGRISFTPRDIYRHLRQGRAFLYRVGDVGFFVCEKCIESISQEPYMNVWLMWFQPGEGVKVKDEVLAYLDAMSEAGGCEWIDFGTTRNAWVELLKGDFEEHMITLRRKK
jgi:hypothetical protein